MICGMHRKSLAAALVFVLVLPALLSGGTSKTLPPVSREGRVVVTYWEKWTGFEGEGIAAIVDEFNRSQNRIFVEHLTVSNNNQKTLIATAGGDPPDVSGLWDGDVVVFADKNAVVPLDGFIRDAGIKAEDYIPVYWDICTYKGRVWALPSTPATTALHWNKGMFRAAGLDPDRPPKTFTELDDYTRRLTRREAFTGRIIQMGFLPPEPGWWHHGWGHFFGGELWDGGKNILIDTKPYHDAFNWIASYSRNFGVTSLQNFRSSFGNFSSPQNPFMSGKVAMVLQGVWMANFIYQYAPDMEWGAAPFPVVNPGDDPVTFAGLDMLMIPRGAKHPREAFEFMSYVNRQGPMERLCLSHRKNSPLREVSEDFYRNHKNPFIRMFQELAWSKNAVHAPKMSIWNEYNREIYNAFERVWIQEVSPAKALADAKERIQKSWDRAYARDQMKSSPQHSLLLKLAPFAIAFAILLGVVLVGLVREIRLRREVGGRERKGIFLELGKGLGFASPWLIGLALFVMYPVAASIIYSFCDYSVLSDPFWVGLSNFLEIAGDEVFWKSLGNTLFFAAFALPLGLLIALVVALILDTGVRGMGIYRTLFFLPSVTPMVASAMIWLWIFNSEFGVLNYVIGKSTLGLIQPIPWLIDKRFAMYALILMGFWGIGGTMVILLAALQDVPVYLYEAADLDGASWVQKIMHVTLPMISPVIYFNVIMGVIGVLQVFAIPFIMTGGGPARSTLFYTMYLYESAFQDLRMGYACAMAWILFLIILVLTLAAVRIASRRVHYVGN